MAGELGSGRGVAEYSLRPRERRSAPLTRLCKETRLLPKPTARSSCRGAAAGCAARSRACTRGCRCRSAASAADSTSLLGTRVPAGLSTEIWREG